MLKLSDYVIQFLAERGCNDIFLVAGGGIMHLLDSVGRNQSVRYYCNYHEQACAASAEGYARITGKVGVCMATTGPGAANAMAGAIASWYDSVPLLVISGQVRRDIIADYGKLRQIGPQEGDILSMVRPVSKYAARVMDPLSIRRELEHAICAATTGRPGPAWIEIPLDIQASMIDPSALPAYEGKPPDGSPARVDVESALAAIHAARRPMIVCGNGIHRSGANAVLRELLDRTQIPIVLPHVGKDLIEEDHPCNMGIFGTVGQRRANFAIQSCDCLVSIGTGLNIHKMGFNVAGFAPKAVKVVVDIDEGQLLHQVLKPDIPVRADARRFIEALLAELDKAPYHAPRRWLDACRHWKEAYPIDRPEFEHDEAYVNSYVFMDRLSGLVDANDVLIAGNGLDTVSYHQAFRVKKGQRAMTSGWGSMGWDLPLTVGACIASGKARTVCVTGDGSIQWNIQELLTIRHYGLPVKIFVFNNQGYLTIRATQAAFFEGRSVGADEKSGVSNPDFRLLAAAYGFHYKRIADNTQLNEGIAAALASPGPSLCEVMIWPGQPLAPKASAFRREDGTLESRPLEDMSPFLPREEVWRNMHMFDDETEKA